MKGSQHVKRIASCYTIQVEDFRFRLRPSGCYCGLGSRLFVSLGCVFVVWSLRIMAGVRDHLMIGSEGTISHCSPNGVPARCFSVHVSKP